MQELLSKDEIQALLGGAQPGQLACGPGGNMDVILDVPVTLSVELGRARLPIRKLINIDGEALIELDTDEGSSVNIYANGVLIALGSLQTSGGKRAVRIVELLGASQHTRHGEGGG